MISVSSNTKAFLIMTIIAIVFITKVWFLIARAHVPPPPPTAIRELLEKQYLAFIQDQNIVVYNGLGQHLSTITQPTEPRVARSFYMTDVSASGSVVVVNENSRFSNLPKQTYEILLYDHQSLDAPKRIYSYDSNATYFLRYPCFSPNGQHIAFINISTSTIHIFSSISGLSERSFTLPKGAPELLQWVDNEHLAVETYDRLDYTDRYPTEKIETGAIALQEAKLKYDTQVLPPVTVIAKDGTAYSIDAAQAFPETRHPKGIARLDINAGTISYPCYVLSGNWWQEPEYRCHESPEYIALYGDTDHRVHSPIFSPDRRFYFSENRKEDLLYKEWIEGYDRVTKTVFHVVTTRWYFPYIP